MVAGTLYTYPDSYRGLKAKVAAKYSGFNLKVVEVQGDDKQHVKVPAFATDDGKFTLFESNSIAYYVANDQLRGGSSQEQRAEVLQWLEYGNSDVYSASASWVFPLLHLVEYHKNSVERAKDELKQVLNVLNQHLKTRTYLVGERLTLADVAVASDLLLAYQYVLDAKFREPYTNTNRWFTTVVNQPHFKTVLGEFKLCEKALEYSAKGGKQQQQQQQAEKPAPAAKKEEKKAEKKEEKKPEKKKEEKPTADDDAEEEDPALQEPKANDPFAAFPKSSFNLDEFKRTYSNKELSESLPYFWQNFDRENYSVWFCEYKYPEDLGQVFMSSNLIGGMYQRLEKLRKHAFASMCVWGSNGANNNTIAGVWFWKGHDLVFPLCPDWTTDYESFSWRKLNLDDENERKLVNQVFSWEGDLNGKKYADGKIFK